MTKIEDLALSYVLAEPDDKSALREIASKAAKEIENARASRAVVGNWAASVRPWVSPSQTDPQLGGVDSTDNIIARAKALDFLASSLVELDENLLSADQVQQLAAYFGSIFSSDHKAGIQPSTKALRRLYSMKHFGPAPGVKIIEDIAKIEDDVVNQLATTRRDIFQLVLLLVQDPRIRTELRQIYGPSCDFATGIVQICKKERDPDNLMVCFSIYREILAKYAPSQEATALVFDAFSSYFPISIRQSATPSGVTVDNLKSTLRACFASGHGVAPFAFPFLLQKLDLGDAVTLAVKLDILQTLRSCAESYDDPKESLAPYSDKVWNSLKYEVRNGEVEEAITATLDVLRVFAARLDGELNLQKPDAAHASSFVDRVWSDCCDDIDNATYAKQACLLLTTVTTANIRVFLQNRFRVLGLVRKSLVQPRSQSHIRDLLGLLNGLLKARSEFAQNKKSAQPNDERDLMAEPHSFFEEVFELQRKHSPSGGREPNFEPTQEEAEVLAEVYRGHALLISQQSVLPDGRVVLSCSRTICDTICLNLCLALFLRIKTEAVANTSPLLDREAVQALRTAVTYYKDGFRIVLDEFQAIASTAGFTRIQQQLDIMKEALGRLVFVGCSQLPMNRTANALLPETQPNPVEEPLDSPPRAYSALQNLEAIVHTFLFSPMFGTLQFPPRELADSPDAPWKALLRPHLVNAVHLAILHFRDACIDKYGPDVLRTAGFDKSWTAEFEAGIDFQAGYWHPRVPDNDPTVYCEFLRFGLFIVWSLYRDATHGSGAMYSEKVIRDVGSMASLVIRSLDEKLQTSCNLAREAFNLFRDPRQSSDAAGEKRYSEYLTLGILEGLWPGAMGDLYEPNGAAERFMCDTSWSGDALAGTVRARASIGAILANKYRQGKTTTGPEGQVMKHVLHFWAGYLTDDARCSTQERAAFEATVNFAMHIMAGAIARQDRDVLPLASVLHETIGKDNTNSDVVARSMGILVKDAPCLKEENHAVLRRLSKQWAYQHFARPLYEKACPVAKGPAAVRYAIALISIVGHCVFAVYQDDVEPLCRLLVTALGEPSVFPAASVYSVLRVLGAVLANQRGAIKEHLATVVAGTEKLYHTADARCREEVLRLLGALPMHLEHQDLIPFSSEMQRFLATTSGDSVRSNRTAALAARQHWAKVA